MDHAIAEHSKRFELQPHPREGQMHAAEPLHHHERYDPIMDGMYQHDSQGSGPLTAEELEQRRKRYGRPPGAKDKKPRRRRTKAQMEEDALLYGVRPEDDMWNSLGSKRRRLVRSSSLGELHGFHGPVFSLPSSPRLSALHTSQTSPRNLRLSTSAPHSILERAYHHDTQNRISGSNAYSFQRSPPTSGHFWEHPQQWNRHQLPLQPRPQGYQPHSHPGLMPHHTEGLLPHQQLPHHHHHHHHPPPPPPPPPPSSSSSSLRHFHHQQAQQQHHRQLPSLSFPSQNQQPWGRRSISPTSGRAMSGLQPTAWGQSNPSPATERRGSESEDSASVESSRASQATSTAYSTSSDSRLLNSSKDSHHPGSYGHSAAAPAERVKQMDNSRRTTPSLKDLLNDSDDTPVPSRPHQRSIVTAEFGKLRVDEERKNSESSRFHDSDSGRPTLFDARGYSMRDQGTSLFRGTPIQPNMIRI